MTADIGSDIDGEVTRNESVKYLQGALGHAVGSLLFLVVGGGLVLVGGLIHGWLFVGIAVLLTLNGASIWAWDGLREFFSPPADGDTGPTRTLTATPLSTESLVEIKAGAVMTVGFCALLLGGQAVIHAVGIQGLGVVVVVGLTVSNILALRRARTETP